MNVSNDFDQHAPHAEKHYVQSRSEDSRRMMILGEHVSTILWAINQCALPLWGVAIVVNDSTLTFGGFSWLII